MFFNWHNTLSKQHTLYLRERVLLFLLSVIVMIEVHLQNYLRVLCNTNYLKKQKSYHLYITEKLWTVTWLSTTSFSFDRFLQHPTPKIVGCHRNPSNFFLFIGTQALETTKFRLFTSWHGMAFYQQVAAFHGKVSIVSFSDLQKKSEIGDHGNEL